MEVCAVESGRIATLLLSLDSLLATK